MALRDMTLIFAEEENESLNKLKERLVTPDINTEWKYRGNRITLFYLITIAQHYNVYATQKIN